MPELTPAQLEEAVNEVYACYEGMLNACLPGDENADERLRHQEYIANMLEDIESLSHLAEIVKGMLFLPGIRSDN